MAESATPAPAKSVTDHVKEGGFCMALSYLIVTAPTEWLGLIPAVPGEHYLTTIAALAGVLTGLGKAAAWIYRKRNQSMEMKT